MLNKKSQYFLIIQRAVSYCLFIFSATVILFLFIEIFKYKIEGLSEVRKKYKEILKNAKGSVILCTNHLTLIDSIIQFIILNSIAGYLLNFSSMPWNLPEKANFYHKLSWRTLCYLGKCIPVQRMSDLKTRKKTIEKIQYVLGKGDVISIFPEGKRSRNGLIDESDFSYGAGNLLKDLERPTVICIYLRGRKNGGFAKYPKKGEIFYIDIESFIPISANTGLRKVKDLSTQIITKLKIMENKYFENKATHRQ
ncbi:MAG: 1-acyl-sn-glycerol-3-phosphate acyltransferase [Legionellales bacterium]|nr:1-acyl-sn-glycerol-3-phosphate acyltransferase [Legionellales bacterium]